LAILLVVGVGSEEASWGAILYGPSPYLSFADSPFPTGSFDYFHLEDFEDAALNTPGASASSGSPLPPGSLTDSVDGDNGPIDGSGTSGYSWYVTQTGVTFTFDENVLGALPTHAGMVLTDIGFVLDGSIGVGSVSFEAFDADSISLGVVGPIVFGDGLAGGQTAEDRFFGAAHLGGISRISFVLNSADWELDHLQYGAVPEPSSLLLAALSALALCLRSKN
jgi:hypothetical protein